MRGISSVTPLACRYAGATSVGLWMRCSTRVTSRKPGVSRTRPPPGSQGPTNACASLKPAGHGDRSRRCPVTCCSRSAGERTPGRGRGKRVVCRPDRGSPRASSSPSDAHRDARQRPVSADTQSRRRSAEICASDAPAAHGFSRIQPDSTGSTDLGVFPCKQAISGSMTGDRSMGSGDFESRWRYLGKPCKSGVFGRRKGASAPVLVTTVPWEPDR